MLPCIMYIRVRALRKYVHAPNPSSLALPLLESHYSRTRSPVFGHQPADQPLVSRGSARAPRSTVHWHQKQARGLRGGGCSAAQRDASGLRWRVGGRRPAAQVFYAGFRSVYPSRRRPYVVRTACTRGGNGVGIQYSIVNSAPHTRIHAAKQGAQEAEFAQGSTKHAGGAVIERTGMGSERREARHATPARVRITHYRRIERSPSVRRLLVR
ncbi:hypothetical protein OH76DRAFT_830500 [Lentinus brumalis]|uniref:Uncharacterized protein n=1 Tax=Lentinus brumalis TaxID=2498619 RepID=A0A371D1U5_9APHY|nr:hypothetical protein OH76DRAFT_830500 [Polyporus brumalis]